MTGVHKPIDSYSYRLILSEIGIDVNHSTIGPDGKKITVYGWTNISADQLEDLKNKAIILLKEKHPHNEFSMMLTIRTGVVKDSSYP